MNTSLTPAELRILGLLAQGLGLKEMSAKIGRSHHTIGVQKATLYRKLNVKTNVQAVLAGARLGYIELPSLKGTYETTALTPARRPPGSASAPNDCVPAVRPGWRTTYYYI